MDIRWHPGNDGEKRWPDLVDGSCRHLFLSGHQGGQQVDPPDQNEDLEAYDHEADGCIDEKAVIERYCPGLLRYREGGVG
ncbi:hypothetical protein LFE_0023 [Leptospirillum ferrooxidans C2-3]|uniref:Uncharacterized protein n=1 Tax=Leptospirillum ferrooxidans (strain C2-3) TaxID=1162668 RepID=I0IKF5_LEPFC|nr:hypothetical protein LFE_0023 [Leptospirillum ferrooxidans C2-3]